MRILRYDISGEPRTARRLGVMLDGGIIGDLRAGYGRHLADGGDPHGRQIAALRIPATLAALLSSGPKAMDAARAGHGWLEAHASPEPAARGLDGEPLFAPRKDCTIHSPIHPSKVIAVGRNYRAHTAEMGSKNPMKVPSAWIKANSAVWGPYRDIVKPAACHDMDYETEMAFVIGEKCKNVPEDKAYDVIAGYIVTNDVTARDINRIERAEGNRLLGKNFDGFCPTGPWLTTADEIADPMKLRLITRVNGHVRQDANTSDMIWSIPQMVAYVSQMTLEPGDIVLTGSPEGVASGKGDNTGSFLTPGDVLESEIEGIGTLRNTIVEDTLAPSWDW